MSASYRYSWESAVGATGVTDSFSHTPTTFEAGAAFDATVDRFGPFQSEYMGGFNNIGLHIEFPYVPASGHLIELTATAVGILSGRHAGLSGDWANSALLDLQLPPGYFLADADGNRLAFNWDGTGGNGVPAIPEPETWLLFAIGAALLALKRRHDGRILQERLRAPATDFAVAVAVAVSGGAARVVGAIQMSPQRSWSRRSQPAQEGFRH